MKTTYQYQFYPNTNQKLALNQWLRICRYWYNRQLGDRFDWWDNNRTAVNACPLIVSISALREKPNYYSQKQQLPLFKKDVVKVFHSGEILDFKQVFLRNEINGNEVLNLDVNWPKKKLFDIKRLLGLVKTSIIKPLIS